MNGNGRLEYGGIIRHMSPSTCPVNALAIWFFWNWHCQHQPYPNFTPSVSASGELLHVPWQDEFLVPGFARGTSRPDPTKPLTYESMHEEWSSALQQIPHPVRSSKKTHIERSSGAIHAELMGVDSNDIARLGHWGGDVLHKRYLTNLPMPAIWRIAGASEDHGTDYTITRDVAVPPALVCQIFPWVRLARESIATSWPDGTSHVVTPFLDLVDWLAIVLVQDAAYMADQWQTHPIYGYAPFTAPEFQDYISIQQVSITTAETQVKRKRTATVGDLEDMAATIKRALTSVANRASNHPSPHDAEESSIDEDRPAPALTISESRPQSQHHPSSAVIDTPSQPTFDIRTFPHSPSDWPGECPNWLKLMPLPRGANGIRTVKDVYELWETGRDGFPPLRYVIEKYTGRHNSWVDRRQSEKQWTRIYRRVAETWTGLTETQGIETRAKLQKIMDDRRANGPINSSSIQWLAKYLTEQREGAKELSKLKKSIHKVSKARRLVRKEKE